ncbi:MAG: hypothetical protein KBA90_13210 [Chitinophagaceae bacterium]|nr:hypothetical protein [Chitinophagaceae bacterium]
MGKQKSLNFIIPLVVYPFDVMISFGETDEQLKKVMGKYDIEWSENMKVVGQGLFYMTDLNQSMIRLKKIPESSEDYGYLHHEIFHAVTYILNRVGMKLVLGKSCEAYSYLVGYITTEIYKKL